MHHILELTAEMKELVSNQEWREALEVSERITKLLVTYKTAC